MSVVRVAFAWGTELDAATNDIRDRVDRALGRLPDDVDRPMIRKFDLSAFPILIVGVSSNLDPLDLRQLMEDQVKYRLERVPGVAAVDIWGGLNRRGPRRPPRGPAQGAGAVHGRDSGGPEQ